MSRKVGKSKFMRMMEDPYCDAEARFSIDIDLPYDFMKPNADRSVTGVAITIMAPTAKEARRLTVESLKKLIEVFSSELACLEKLK